MRKVLSLARDPVCIGRDIIMTDKRPLKARDFLTGVSTGRTFSVHPVIPTRGSIVTTVSR